MKNISRSWTVVYKVKECEPSAFTYTSEKDAISAKQMVEDANGGELLGDQAITTAILDRILHRVEIIHLNEDSYRMKHRSTIFGEQSVSK